MLEGWIFCTGPSFHRAVGLPRSSHPRQIQSTPQGRSVIQGIRARDGSAASAAGGGRANAENAWTQFTWNPRSQASHTTVAPSISAFLQRAHGTGGDPTPASPGFSAGGRRLPSPTATERRTFARWYATTQAYAWRGEGERGGGGAGSLRPGMGGRWRRSIRVLRRGLALGHSKAWRRARTTRIEHELEEARGLKQRGICDARGEEKEGHVAGGEVG